MKSLRKMINNPKSIPIIWLTICFMFILTKIGYVISWWSDIVWFLVEVPKQTPIDMPDYPGLKVWHASRGLVALCTVIGFGILGLIWTRRLFKISKKQPPAKQPSCDGFSEN